MRDEWIVPDWPAPAKVRAVSTTRLGGVSTGVYASLNLGLHVGDAAQSVAENRRRLRAELDLHKEPHWLKQTHSARVVHLPAGDSHKSLSGDAAVAQSADAACVIMTADCLPVLLCDRAGGVVAAAHAGWRSLAAGVLENSVQALRVAPAELMAWLGPAIGPDVYEVGDEVLRRFVDQDARAAVAFRRKPNGRWLCDLYTLARMRLQVLGVTQIYGGGFCTFTDKHRFFSYRRDGECGRMGTFIWLSS